MKKLYLYILLIVALLAFPAAASASSNFEFETETDMTGSQEAPTPVMTDMTGNTELVFGGRGLRFRLKVDNNTNDIFAAHIHCGPPGVAGPVGVTLFMGSFTDQSGVVAKGLITEPDAGNACGWESINHVAQAILDGNAYVNVHTTADSGGFPSGEIRGDIPLPRFPAHLSFETETDMTGSQEVPPVMTDMTGNAELVFGGRGLRVRLKVSNNTNDIFAAHIHCGPPGENGPVGVTLFMGSFTDRKGVLVRELFTEPDPGNACGWTSIDDIAAAVLDGNAYVNVHTTLDSGGVPSGEIRGDIPLPRH
jgi:Cu/Zn superoxide dismutase